MKDSNKLFGTYNTTKALCPKISYTSNKAQNEKTKQKIYVTVILCGAGTRKQEMYTYFLECSKRLHSRQEMSEQLQNYMTDLL
jgi:hypothetical protein